jgi:hypothetical protein
VAPPALIRDDRHRGTAGAAPHRAAPPTDLRAPPLPRHLSEVALARDFEVVGCARPQRSEKRFLLCKQGHCGIFAPVYSRQYELEG